jgi:hypothetical protein
LKLQQYITEQVKFDLITRQILDKYPLLFGKLGNMKQITDDELCNMLTGIYYPEHGYIFRPTESKSGWDIMINGDIIIYIGDDLFDMDDITDHDLDELKPNKFIKSVVRFVNAALTLMKKIDSLKGDWSYIPATPLKDFLLSNMEDMACKAGAEETVYGITKIDTLYGTVFGDTIYKKFKGLTTKYILQSYIDLN